MPYCTITDVEARLPSAFVIAMTNDVGGNTLGQDAFDQAVDDADSLINSYMRSRYTVPFSTTPKIVNRIAVDLTIYFIYQRKFDQEISDSVRMRYKDSVKLLEGIQSGSIHIDDVPSPDAEVPRLAKTNKTSADRMFGRTVLDRY